MRELAYQQRVLALMDGYLEELGRRRARADKIAAAIAAEGIEEGPSTDFPGEAWEKLRKAGMLPKSRAGVPYSSRVNKIGRQVPNVVYKVPTGGGKTFLAVASISKILNKYLGRRTGFVLWIVPNEAIYTQTELQLKDRRHPYRQMLDTLSGNAVKLMDKESKLTRADVEQHLCVMLLMLQSSNRQDKRVLRLFRDRGDVEGFTPEEADWHEHAKLKAAVPNLDTYSTAEGGAPWTMVKDSLGNALRLIEPVVIMDEGHRAVSDLAQRTLNDLNPSFVLELTATPKDVREKKGANPRPARYHNILAEVTGAELVREQMIKMPLNLDARQRTDWESTLDAALGKLKELQRQAGELYANHSRYIRPILLVQVERTGKDQRGGGHVHSEDVREWLLSTGGLRPDEVAVKTADQNELKSPEHQDLLSKYNQTRVIITKQALQEGWDCPFAYVLCSLASGSSQSALTQLVGRILRQPYAQLTGVEALDQSYVFTHHTNTASAVEAIKKGLERDGMGDMAASVSVVGAEGSGKTGRTLSRRKKFRREEIFLPKVLRVAEGEVRELEYEADILCSLDWRGLDVGGLLARIPKESDAAQRQLSRVYVDRKGGAVRASEAKSAAEERVFDRAYATQFIADIVPNAWQARQIVGDVADGLLARGASEEELGGMASLIHGELRAWLQERRDAMAEAVFRAEVEAERIQFRLRTDGNIGDVHWKMPFKMQTQRGKKAQRLHRDNGKPLQKDIFEVFRKDLNKGERRVAVYIDSRRAVRWWHRNVSRHHYGLQGWRRDRIYPDFICSVKPAKDGKKRGEKLVVLEMKGDHLAGSEDSQYKADVMRLLTESFSIEEASRLGQVELEIEDGTVVECELVVFKKWKARLAKLLERPSAA